MAAISPKEKEMNLIRLCIAAVLVSTCLGDVALSQEQPIQTPDPNAWIQRLPKDPTRMPGYTIIRATSKGRFELTFIEYPDDRDCDPSPCSKWRGVRANDPPYDKPYFFYLDGNLNEYKQRVDVGGTLLPTRVLDKSLKFPFKAKNSSWSWRVDDLVGGWYTVVGETKGWEQPPGMPDLSYRTVHIHIQAECNPCAAKPSSYVYEIYYAPGPGIIAWEATSTGYVSIFRGIENIKI